MLRPATESDKDDVRVWRNHPDVQAMSLSQDEITPQMHERWWQAVQSDPSRQVLMYVRGERTCGVVNFFDIAEHDDGTRSAMWGYYLDNAGLTERGELLPAWMQIQRDAVKYADTELDLDVLEGEVLDANEAVRRMDRRNGFEEVGSTERVVAGTPTTVHHIRRQRPTR